MSQNAFQDRVSKLQANEPPDTVGVEHRNSPTFATHDMKSAVRGLLASAFFLTLFNNIQVISDLAPESVKNSDSPGAWGVPVALISIAWFTIIPIWVCVSTMIASFTGKFSSSNPFVLGAALGLLVGFPIIGLIGMAGS